MTDLESIQSEIVTVLRNNVSDVLSLRSNRGQNFIFPGFPRYDAGTPRIGITYVTSPLESLAIGSSKRRHNARFQVTVLIRETDKIDIDDDGEKETAEKVADYLSNECIKAIEGSSYTNAWKCSVSEQAVLRKDGYIYMILEIETMIVRGS